MTTTSIEWTDKTWNPVTGCTKVSPGCQHCYAETIANRKLPYGGFTDRSFTDVRTHADRLDQPLHWKKPARIFVNSMSDLFHEDVPDAFIDQVFAVMHLTERHTFQILTKRAERMRDYILSRTQADPGHVCIWTEQGPREHNGVSEGFKYRVPWPLPNVWLGVSVENQRYADERIPLLLQTPAAMRFISAEPLLGPVDLHSAVLEADSDGYLDWVIVGGESGHGARPLRLGWARFIVQQCKAAGVRVFVKQLGANATANYYDQPTRRFIESRGMDWPDPFGWHERDGQPALSDRVALPIHAKGGDPSEWPEDLRVREFPNDARGDI